MENSIYILHEDTDILVLDKPAGIIVNRADTTRHETTVQDWAEAHLHIVPSENSYPPDDPRSVFFERGGIVHRIDKETSGILLLAKNPEAFIALQKQFKERVVEKTYLALTHGKVIPAEGEINVPVGRLPWNRKQFGVVAGGRESQTTYKVTRYYKNEDETLTLVTLFPHTGRTHQIRVHLKYIGFPIFGDYLYAGRKIQRDDRLVLARVFLHAAGIRFIHPKTQEFLTYESPLPPELQQVLDALENLGNP